MGAWKPMWEEGLRQKLGDGAAATEKLMNGWGHIPQRSVSARPTEKVEPSPIEIPLWLECLDSTGKHSREAALEFPPRHS